MALPLPEHDDVHGRADSAPVTVRGQDPKLARRLAPEERCDRSRSWARRLVVIALRDIHDRLIPNEARHLALSSELFEFRPTADGGPAGRPARRRCIGEPVDPPEASAGTRVGPALVRSPGDDLAGVMVPGLIAGGRPSSSSG